MQGCRQLLRSGGGLSLYRAAGSNLRMVRPSLMLVVKLVVIHTRKVHSKILDLASYLLVKWCSHCTSASNWELSLLCFPALQENTYDFSYCNQCCEREKLQCVAHAGWRLGYVQQHSKFDWTGVWYCMSTRTELTNLPMCSVANEFVARNDSRIRIFGHSVWASIFACKTACL